MVNPLTMSFEDISYTLRGIHDPLVQRQEVRPLYDSLSKIVMNSTHVADSIDFTLVKKADVVNEKIPEFVPSFSMLKEIACQMACKSFDVSTVHETITEILKKLKGHTWDAKAVIALAAFALDYGESWRLSLITQANKQDALELHVFTLGDVEKGESTQLIDQLKNLVNLTILPLIDKIIALEKKIDENRKILKEGLPAVRRDACTYWALYALAFASQITPQNKGLISKVQGMLGDASGELDQALQEIDKYKADRELRDRIIKVIRSPSGILQLLNALIIFLENKELEILDLRNDKLAVQEVLGDIGNEKLLLFISGLDNIDKEIVKLQSIEAEMEKNKSKESYRILWIPVVESWSKELEDKFESIKSKFELQWYVPKNYERCIDIEVFRKEFHYNGKPIVVVTDRGGKILHKNAMYMIFVWGMDAFPFLPDNQRNLTAKWNWLWSGALKFHPDVKKWVKSGKYIFLYRTDKDNKAKSCLAELIQGIKQLVIQKYGEDSAVHFDLGQAAEESEFWENIDHSFYDNYAEVTDITKILSLKEKREWFLVSKGPDLLLVESDIRGKRKQILGDELESEMAKGFEEGFIKYYNSKRPKVTKYCSHLEVVDIRSGVPKSITCPDCERTLVIDTVTYKCCHGHDHPNTESEEVDQDV